LEFRFRAAKLNLFVQKKRLFFSKFAFCPQQWKP
jgi:hypothetical protein